MDPPAAVEAARKQMAARGHRLEDLEPLPGDVSRRRYFRARLTRGGGTILAIYPQDLRDSCRRFLVSGKLLSEVGVSVPEVYDADCDAGWMLLEDLGPATLFDLYVDRPDPWEELHSPYQEAIAMLRRIAEIDEDAAAQLNPPLDGALLRRELRQTWEAFFEPRGYHRNRGLGAELNATLEALCEALAAEPLVPCHRDFMVRNLIPRPAGLAVLDHQDLRLGPRFYDLASFLNDSLFPPPDFVERLLAPQASSPAERLGYHRAAAQRTLKAVGTFARHGSPKHERLIPPTLRRACAHLALVPEASKIEGDLRQGGRLAGEYPDFKTALDWIC